jgi:hypothetical protein
MTRLPKKTRSQHLHFSMITCDYQRGKIDLHGFYPCFHSDSSGNQPEVSAAGVISDFPNEIRPPYEHTGTVFIEQRTSATALGGATNSTVVRSSAKEVTEPFQRTLQALSNPTWLPTSKQLHSDGKNLPSHSPIASSMRSTSTLYASQTSRPVNSR